MATQGTEANDFDFAAAAHIIKRPRLTRILDASEDRVILLLAPAGYGKTTLAREWVATRKERIYWYSGGTAMSDVAALAVDLAEVFAGADSELAERVRFLASRGESAHVLAKAVATGAPGTAALVVADDYHLAGEGSDADEFFSELVALTSFRLLLCSRVRPAWLDARRTVYGEALVVEQEELAFTPEEGTEVLPEGGAVLEQAHGWPAVIGLAAARGTKGEELQQLPPNELYEFMANDLFGSATPSLRRSLIMLGCGGDASRDVARTLLGRSFNSALHEALARGFAVQDDHGWIDIHPLLRMFLLRQLQELEPQQRLRTVMRVLRVLREHEKWDECLRLLEHFDLEDEADRTLRAAIPDLFAVGRTATLARWTELGKARSYQSATFALALAEVELRQGRDADALAVATEAATRLEGDHAARAELIAARAAHQLDDFLTTTHHAERAGELARSSNLRTEAYWLALVNAYEREPDTIRRFFARFRSLDDPRPEWSLRLACGEAFISLTYERDALAAVAAARRAVALAPRIRDPYLRTNALNIHANLLAIVGEYGAAVEGADRLIAEAAETGLDFVVNHALVAKANALIGLRAIGRARLALRELDSRKRDNVHIAANAAMAQARLYIAMGDLDRALLSLSVSPATFTPLLQGEFFGLRALAAAARGDEVSAEEALLLTLQAREFEEAATYRELTSAVLSLRRRPDPRIAYSTITEALHRGIANAVVVACRAWPDLAALATSGGAATALRGLFTRSNDLDLSRRAGISIPRELRRREALSPREQEVYELLREGRTNEEIAKALFISLSTAKVHVRHIYEKLGVHSRAEAAAADLSED